MNNTKFAHVVDMQINYCMDLLSVKNSEYTPGVDTKTDRLAHFKKAAALSNTDPKAALFGMFSKHIVSVADMCNSSDTYTKARWNEKISDSINYLLLLRALVEEEEEAKHDKY